MIINDNIITVIVDDDDDDDDNSITIHFVYIGEHDTSCVGEVGMMYDA